MSDTLITIVAIFLAAILMFVFPLMSVAERGDDMSQLSVTTATTEFVDNYSKLVSAIQATGNAYDIEIEVKVLDENIGKKSAWTSGTVIGENVYYSVYTSQIMDVLESGSAYNMKEGDIMSVSVKNTNKTMAQTIRSAFYSISGSDTYQIVAQHAGMVQATGSK